MKVSVLDVDEPPKFHPLSGIIEVSEDAHIGSVIGAITATDPDKANNSIRYHAERRACERFPARVEDFLLCACLG